MGNSPAVIDRFYKGAIGKVELEKFWRTVPKAAADQPSASAQLPAQDKGVKTRGH